MISAPIFRSEDSDIIFVEAEILQQAVENGKWLRHAEGGFSSDLKKLCDEHLDGTCKWFLRNDIVENWKSPRSVPGLWVSGKPGCGKSTIASQLILHLSTSTLPVVRVLCKAGMENRSDVMSVLRNILFQLVESPVTTSEKRKLHSVITAARMDSKDPCATSEPKLWVLLKRLLKHSGGCICVIDGLDECGNTSKEIADFITQLTDVFDASPKSKAVVFSRLDIPVTCNNTSVWESISIKVADVRDDIEYLVRVNVENLELRNPEVKDRLRRQLISGSEGMMLWARLMLSEIKYNHYRIDEVLKKPPVGLKVLYNDILQRLANSESDTRRMQNALVLRLVLAAARPLRLHEFCLAVEMLKGLPDHENYEFREDNARTIINEAAPLVTVLPNNTVQIVHTSLKDYLLSSGYSQDTRLNNFVFESSNLHSPIVFALLSYLSFSCFNVNLVGAPVDHVNSYPLLEYASTQLIWHVTKVDDHYQDCLQQLRTFLESTQGWRWLERLRYTYECSMGHLQLFEAHLKGWIDTFSPKLSDREIFDNLLTHLCQKQVNDTIQCNADSERHLEAISSLAEVYWSKGKLKEAEDRIVYVMEMRKSELGHEHPTTLTSTNNLSLIYNDQGRWKEAMELLADVMETRIRVLGQEHPDTLISMSSLATIYQNQGQWRRAENLKLKVLEVRRRDLGQEHPYTLMSQSNLAVTYQQQGRWREAEELQVEVLKIEKRVLGRLHPETLRGMSNLAWTYMKLGGLKEAEELQVRALRTRKKVLGQEHPDTLESMSSMAWIYQSKGFIDDAISLIEQLVELRLKTLGADHPCTKDSIEDMMAWRESRVEASTGHPGKASF